MWALGWTRDTSYGRGQARSASLYRSWENKFGRHCLPWIRRSGSLGAAQNSHRTTAASRHTESQLIRLRSLVAPRLD